MKETISDLARAGNDDWNRVTVSIMFMFWSQFVHEKIVPRTSDQSDKQRGPFANEIKTAMQYIYSYVEQNSEE